MQDQLRIECGYFWKTKNIAFKYNIYIGIDDIPSKVEHGHQEF